MQKILVTDTLFVLKEHEEKIRAAGYEIERLTNSLVSEEELAAAVRGKVGYIVGGLERVTEPVIDAADQLKAIALAGAGYPRFIPAWKYALGKGIAITNTPDGPTQEAAEWAVTAALVMNRHFFELGRVNSETRFMVTQGLEGQRVGIVGLGHIGTRIAEMLQVFRPKEVVYYSRHRKMDTERRLGVVYQDLKTLLSQNDVIFLCITAGTENKGFVGKAELSLMQKDSLLVSILHPGVLNETALLEVLRGNRIRAISDYPMNEAFNSLPLDRWYCMNSTNTLTEAGVRHMSDMAVSSLLNVLATGKDPYVITA